MRLASCERCEGFLPSAATRCPHCRARPSLGRKLLNVAGGGAVAITLMACYGGAPHMYAPQAPDRGCNAGAEDIDGDGWCAPHDCDEVDPKVHPEAADNDADGIDQNCDGQDGRAGAIAR